MNNGCAQKRILLYVLLPAAVLYFGLRFYAQFRHVDIYVSRAAPMPDELASGLHMKEHKIDPTVMIESPYDTAAEKKLSLEEIGRLRSALAWGSSMPPLIDTLTIQSPTNVLARRNGRDSMREYQIAKIGNRWVIESMTQSQVRRFAPD